METILTVLVACLRQMLLLEAHVVISNNTQVISEEISSVLIATRMIATNAISLRKISCLVKKISIMILDLDLMIIVRFARAQLLLHFSIHASEIQVTGEYLRLTYVCITIHSDFHLFILIFILFSLFQCFNDSIASLQTMVVLQGQGLDVFQKLTMMKQSIHVT